MLRSNVRAKHRKFFTWHETIFCFFCIFRLQALAFDFTLLRRKYKTMLNIKNIKPGQRVTVAYASPVTWARVTDNPFVARNVTKETRCAFTAAGADTYGNKAETLGHELSGKPCWHVPAPEIGACVRVHKDKGTPYLAGINHDSAPSTFYIDGRQATSAEVEQIKSFLRERKDGVERGLDFRLWTLDKLQNAILD